MARVPESFDFASSSGTSPKNRYNNIINIHTVVEIRKGKKQKKEITRQRNNNKI